MDSTALNYNPNANTDDNSCLFAGCTNPEAENYDSLASVDDGSCIIVGCGVNAWFVCNYNPDVTLNDWSICEFDFSGAQCGNSAMAISGPDAHPVLYLSDVTDDAIDAYYYLGDERIGCMDKNAENYLESAVLDNESCIYLGYDALGPIIDNTIKVYPQPATTHVFIEFEVSTEMYNKEYSIHNIIGEKICTGKVEANRKTQINTEKWVSGIYYIVIKVENKNLTHRFVIE